MTPEGLGLQLMNEKEVKAAEGGRKEGTWTVSVLNLSAFAKTHFLNSSVEKVFRLPISERRS